MPRSTETRNKDQGKQFLNSNSCNSLHEKGWKDEGNENEFEAKLFDKGQYTE